MPQEEKTACEFCGRLQSVKVFKCPFRYCRPRAACGDCARSRPELKTKAGHRLKGCEQNAELSVKVTRERRQLSASGEYLLSSSIQLSGSIIHALFRSASDKQGRFVTEELYHLAANLMNPTLKDFEHLAGAPLPEAPPEFDSIELPAMLSKAFSQLLGEQPPPVHANEERVRNAREGEGSVSQCLK